MHVTTLVTTAATLLILNTVGANAVAAASWAGPKPVGGIEVMPVHNSCHAGIQTHGGAYPPHSHRPSDCRVILSRGTGGGDCHADVRRHNVPAFGNVWHRHSSSCNVITYEEHQGPGP